MNPVAKSSTISFHMISYKEQKKITKTKIRKSTAKRETEKKCILNLKYSLNCNLKGKYLFHQIESYIYFSHGPTFKMEVCV